MFDQRALQLVSSYVAAEEAFAKNFPKVCKELIVLMAAIAERLDYEWHKRAKIELGKESYVLSPDGDGGWKWEKADLTEEYDDVECDLWNSDTPMLPPTTAPKLLIGSSEQEEQTVDKVVISPPDHIDEQHWQELVESSAIHPDIASRNFRSLHTDPIEQANEAWEYVMYSDKISRRNDGRLRDGDLNRYQHLEQGGWWCSSGVDPRSFADLQPGDKPDNKLWGCFKPNEPRVKRDEHDQIIEGKFIKYEHPPKTDLSIFLLDVPDDVAGRIYDKAGVQPTESDRQSGFWYCVWKHNVPVTITEGAKKAASFLSQGHAAIGLPGIYAGYRSRDEQGYDIPPKLHPELAVFATKDREITFCFDYETRPKTVRNIEISTLRTAGLLEEQGAKVNVIRLPGPDKGVDDFIVNNGSEEFETLVEQAESLEEWHKHNQKIWDVKPIKKKLKPEEINNITNKLVNNSPGDPEPDDFRLTIFLKDGTERKLYEQKDGTVSTNVIRENLTDEEILSLGAKPRTPSQSETISSEIIPVESTHVSPDRNSPQVNEEPIQHWAKQRDVAILKNTIPRRQVEATENKFIALAAQALLTNYGIKHDDGSLIYRSDAFTIRKYRELYSIHRANDEKATYFLEPLMQFHVLPKNQVDILLQPKKMLSVERQEFLLVADYLTHGKKLPSLDCDTRELANSLSSLAPKGTQDSLNSIRDGEIIKIMHTVLSKAQSDQVEIDNYHIKSQRDSSAGKVYLRLFKLEDNGKSTEKIRFELTRTPTSVSNQLKIMTLDEFDLAQLKFIAKQLNIETHNQQHNSSASSTNSPESTNHHKTSANSPSQPTSSSDILLPLHPELATAWHKLEESVGWSSSANQGNEQFREKLQQQHKLTVGEQRELYFKILVQTKDEQMQLGRTDIILPNLSVITNDLLSLRRESINSTYTPIQKRSLDVKQHNNQVEYE
ncbi:DUF3854 domain-containing protein [Nostoc sp. CCY0012]|uniref:DUF3854 domain-containing protein n=1 Tax=Nostoc sp. CCY0012 TaxID=1056123 RepID=UPI0039C61F70